jgi:hypothetical protein
MLLLLLLLLLPLLLPMLLQLLLLVRSAGRVHHPKEALIASSTLQSRLLYPRRRNYQCTQVHLYFQGVPLSLHTVAREAITEFDCIRLLLFLGVLGDSERNSR